jgi:hypothetical protein
MIRNGDGWGRRKAQGIQTALSREAVVTRVIASAAIAICAVLSGAAPANASTAWRVQRVPQPPGGIALLQGVSCPAKGNCTAVGFYHKNGTGYTLAEHWNGTRWRIQPTPNAPGATQSLLWGVSCGSATSCMAVGWDTPTTDREQLLAEHWNGRRWTIKPVPNPVTPVTFLYGVSCASPTSTAVWAVLRGLQRPDPAAGRALEREQVDGGALSQRSQLRKPGARADPD